MLEKGVILNIYRYIISLKISPHVVDAEPKLKGA
jgi:hypothetical protein